MTENKRFKRYLLDGGFWFEEYVEAVWAITDRHDKNSPITYIEFKDEYKDICDEVVECLNNLHEEKEYWKGNACNNINFVNILLHELDIAQEKGYEVSDPFKKLMKEELIE